MVASTDYDLNQAEEFDIVVCESNDCNSNEVRIDGKSDDCRRYKKSLCDVFLAVDF